MRILYNLTICPHGRNDQKKELVKRCTKWGAPNDVTRVASIDLNHKKAGQQVPFTKPLFCLEPCIPMIILAVRQTLLMRVKQEDADESVDIRANITSNLAGLVILTNLCLLMFRSNRLIINTRSPILSAYREPTVPL